MVAETGYSNRRALSALPHDEFAAPLIRPGRGPYWRHGWASSVWTVAAPSRQQYGTTL